MAGLGDYKKKEKGNRGYKMKGSPFARNYGIGTPVKKAIWPPGSDSDYEKTLGARLSPDNPEHQGRSEQTFENIKNDHDVNDEGIPQTDPKGYWKKAAKYGVYPTDVREQ